MSLPESPSSTVPGTGVFEPVGRSSDDELPPPRRACVSRRSIALVTVLGLTLLLGATLPSGALLRAGELLRDRLSLWSIRRVKRYPAVFTECVWDTTIAASYLLRGGFELAEATQDCPSVHEIEFDIARRLSDKHPEIVVPPSGYFPGVIDKFGGHVPTVENATKQVKDSCARAKDVLDSLHLRRPHLRTNYSYSQAARKLREEGHFPQANELFRRLHEEEEGIIPEAVLQKKTKEVVRNLCASQISGTIASWSWVAGYLSAAASECAGMMWMKRYCASDIARVVAAIADVVQGATGIVAACNQDLKLTRRIEHREEQEELAEVWESIFDRRLQPVVMPADPTDRLRFGTRDLHDDEEPDTATKVKVLKEQATWDTLHKGVCAVNAAQGALFLGRAALEIVGSLEHCPFAPFDELERLRCAANTQGSFAAFVVTSHVLAEATAACQETKGTLNLEAFCVAWSTQVLHALVELSAALAMLAGDCAMMQAYPHGRPMAEIEENLEKERDEYEESGKTLSLKELVDNPYVN